MTDGKTRWRLRVYVCRMGEIPPPDLPLACCRTGCTYVYTHIKPCTGFMAQTPKPIRLLSPEKRAYNFPCRYWKGMTDTKTGSKEVADLQTFPLGCKGLLDGLSRTRNCCLNKEEFKWAARGDTNNINLCGVQSEVRAGLRGAPSSHRSISHSYLGRWAFIWTCGEAISRS